MRTPTGASSSARTTRDLLNDFANRKKRVFALEVVRREKESKQLQGGAGGLSVGWVDLDLEW